MTKRWFYFIFYMLLGAICFALNLDHIWNIFQWLLHKLIFLFAIFFPIFAIWALFEIPRKPKQTEPGDPAHPAA